MNTQYISLDPWSDFRGASLSFVIGKLGEGTSDKSTTSSSSSYYYCYCYYFIISVTDKVPGMTGGGSFLHSTEEAHKRLYSVESTLAIK